MNQKIELCDTSIEDKIVGGYCHNVGDCWFTRNCLICGSKQELWNPSSETMKEVYVCDECKEAIILVKHFKENIIKGGL